MKYHCVYLELTNCCNRRCSFCGSTSRPPALLDAGVARGWIGQLAELADSIYWHVLGEPLLHPDFPALAAHAAACGLTVRLTTNAALLRQHREFLLSGVVGQINFSLQSLAEVDAPERARVWHDIIDFTRSALRERPELYLNFRWWQDAPPEIAPAAEALGIPEEQWRVPHGRYRKRVTGRLYATYDAAFQWPRETCEAGAPVRGTCHALTRQFAVLSDGTVTACCLDADGQLPLGNAFHAPIAGILASPEAERLREGFRSGIRSAPLCRNCDFARRFRSVRDFH